MNANAHKYAQAYRQTAVSSAALDASPHTLVAMMFKGLRERLDRTMRCLERQDYAQVSLLLQQCDMLVAELDASLNEAAFPSLTQALKDLYTYARHVFVVVNVDHVVEPLIELDEMLASVEQAWKQIGPV